MPPLEAWLAIAAAALLVVAAVHDIVARTIPNRLVLCVAVIGVACRGVAGDLLPALGVAALVFACGVLGWRLGALGGGDVKLLAAVSLLPAPALVPSLIAAVALCGGALALSFLVARPLVPRRPGPRPQSWLARSLRVEAWRVRRRGPLPYAVAIAGGALLTLSA